MPNAWIEFHERQAQMRPELDPRQRATRSFSPVTKKVKSKKLQISILELKHDLKGVSFAADVPAPRKV